MTTTHLFDAELDVDPEATPVEAGEGALFSYVGGGGGTVSGPRLEGELRWSLYEDQGALVCRAQRTGVIETTDGARIELDELGYVTREAEGSPRWRFASGVHFTTRDERYGWLTERPAVLEGVVDLSTGRARLRLATVDAGA